MVTPLTPADEESARAFRLMTDALDLLVAESVLQDGRYADDPAALIERRDALVRRLDVGLGLELAERLGEEALRQAVNEHAPPAARAPLEQLIELEGGMLAVVRNRISGLGSGNDESPVRDGVFRSDDHAIGCGGGALAVVAGVTLNSVLGGITAVAGIMAMAAWC